MADPIISTTEVQDIPNPARAVPGQGGSTDSGGIMRSQPGGGVEDMASGQRQVVDPDAPPVEDTPAEDTTKETPKVEPEKVAETPEEATDLTPEQTTALDAYGAEFTEKGTLSEETLDAISKDPVLAKEAMKRYLQGQAQAPAGLSPEAQTVVDTAYEIVGKGPAYDAFLDTLSDAQKNTLAKAADTNDPEVFKATLAPMHEAYKAAGGGDGPRSLTREGATNGDTNEAQVEGFTSRDEQLKAMRDPKYGKDAKYTAQVDQQVYHATWATKR